MRLHHFGPTPHEVVALHGFSQQGGHFAELAGHLGLGMVAPDLPGHGSDPVLPVDTHATVTALAGLGGRILVAYSMGARLAWRVAMRRDYDLVTVISGTAGIRDEAERAARVIIDDALATRIERDGLAPFLDAWGALPLFAGLRSRGDAWLATDRELRMAHRPAALAAGLRGLGQGAEPAVTDDELAAIASPVLLLAGAADPKYVAEAERLAGVLPNVRLVVHPTAGHALVGEDPAWVADRIGLR